MNIVKNMNVFTNIAKKGKIIKMIETEDTAEQILEYCYGYLISGKEEYLKGLTDKPSEKLKKFRKSKLYKDMLKEITFMIDTD